MMRKIVCTMIFEIFSKPMGDSLGTKIYGTGIHFLGRKAKPGTNGKLSGANDKAQLMYFRILSTIFRETGISASLCFSRKRRPWAFPEKSTT